MLGRLKGLSDPEAKRKAIGAEFIDVFRWGGVCVCVWGGGGVLQGARCISCSHAAY